MPLIIRLVLQRIAVGVFSILAFFGFNPDISIPTTEETIAMHDKQRGLIDRVFLGDGESSAEPTSSILSEKLSDVQQEVGERVGQLVTEDSFGDAGLDGTATSDQFSVKDVVVNLMCLEKTSRYTRMTSGSGVIISQSGLVLTNAHVAYPLLQTSQFDDDTYSCTIRRGGLSNFGYNVEIVYYPIDWLTANKDIMKESAPVGTGENDYAILLITTPVGLAPAVTSFPTASLAVSNSDLVPGGEVTVAGYPSANTGVFAVDTSPGLKIEQTTLEDFYTFSTYDLDILQTGVNSVARRGSSGGGVFKENRLFGIVVTTNDDGSGAYLNALTLPYIKKDFAGDTGILFDTFVTSSLDLLKMRFEVSYMQLLKDTISL